MDPMGKKKPASAQNTIILGAEARAVLQEKANAAQVLARKHFEVEDGMVRIFRLNAGAEAESRPAEPIKILEVNADTVPSGVMPLQFGPAPASGIRFPSVIVEVTPDEFERIRSHDLKLPEGWEIGEELFKPPSHPGGP
jgi:hypothetical protein